jgi:MFS family permease
MASATTGYLLAFGLGGTVAAAYGWRSAFLVLGAIGLPILLCASLILREPRAPNDGVGHLNEGWPAMIAALAGKRCYVLTVGGMILYYAVAYGATVTWFPTYLFRVLKVDLKTIGLLYGTVQAISSTSGTLVGGYLADHLARRDERWLVWLSGLMLLCSFPAFELALIAPELPAFFLFLSIGAFAQYAAMPAIYATAHLICGNARRSTAIAVMFFFANLIGLGGGPLVTGILSDMLGARYGAMGLRFAMMGIVALLVPAAALFWIASKHIIEGKEA